MESDIGRFSLPEPNWEGNRSRRIRGLFEQRMTHGMSLLPPPRQHSLNRDSWPSGRLLFKAAIFLYLKLTAESEEGRPLPRIKARVQDNIFRVRKR